MNVTTRRIALLLTGLLGACGGGGGGGGGGTSTTTPTGPSVTSTSNSVAVGSDFFTPAGTQVPVGTTVTWTFNGGGIAHNVTFNDGAASATQATGTFTRTFSTAGTFNYHCTIHHGSMIGVVVVQ